MLLHSRRPRVAVIGAGIGSLVAVDLARLGLEVLLLDERPRVLGGASASQLARLHSGYHYSGDRTFTSDSLNTAQRCSLGALAWLRGHPEVAPRPGRWWQFVTDDSMTAPAEFLRFCEHLAEFQSGLAADDPVARQLFATGHGPRATPFVTLEPSAYAPFVAAGRVALGVESPERVIDLGALRRSLEQALRSSPRVDVRLSTRVRSVQRHLTGGYELHLEGGERLGTDLIADCTGHDAGVALGGPAHLPSSMSTRLRLVASAPAPARLASAPSMFFLRGVLGNHTNLGDGRIRFVSEPICNLRTAPGTGVPEAWQRLVADPDDPGRWVAGLEAALALPEPPGTPTEVTAVADQVATVLRDTPVGAGEVARDLLGAAITDGYGQLVPDMARCRHVRVTPTVSVDIGATDVWRPDGPVHQRDWLTVLSDGFLTLCPGKFTFGRLAADEAVARILTYLTGATQSAPQPSPPTWDRSSVAIAGLAALPTPVDPGPVP